MTAIKQVKTASNENDLRTFTFPRGIAGFPGASSFAFIYEGKGQMLCMQSIDQPEASFILTPWDEKRLGSAPVLTKEQRTCLKISANEDVVWMLVLNPFADKQWVTANLKAPIAISESTQTGLQCILNNAGLDLRYQWIPQPS
ncbi:MAG: flagellar assembly protein FliW [Ghiorsea sp.]